MKYYREGIEDKKCSWPNDKSCINKFLFSSICLLTQIKLTLFINKF